MVVVNPNDKYYKHPLTFYKNKIIDYENKYLLRNYLNYLRKYTKHKVYRNKQLVSYFDSWRSNYYKIKKNKDSKDFSNSFGCWITIAIIGLLSLKYFSYQYNKRELLY